MHVRPRSSLLMLSLMRPQSFCSCSVLRRDHHRTTEYDGASKRSAAQLHRQPTRREPVPGLFHPRQQGSGQIDFNLNRPVLRHRQRQRHILHASPACQAARPPARPEVFASLNSSTDEASCAPLPSLTETMPCHLLWLLMSCLHDF